MEEAERDRKAVDAASTASLARHVRAPGCMPLSVFTSCCLMAHSWELLSCADCSAGGQQA